MPIGFEDKDPNSTVEARRKLAASDVNSIKALLNQVEAAFGTASSAIAVLSAELGNKISASALTAIEASISATQDAVAALSDVAGDAITETAIISKLESVEGQSRLRIDALQPPQGWQLPVLRRADDLPEDYSEPVDIVMTNETDDYIYFECRRRQVAAPVMTVLPTMTGTGKIGSPISLSNGTPQEATGVTFSKRYLRNGTEEIAAATGDSYTPVAADDGKTIVGEVTIRNAAGGVLVYTVPTPISISYTAPAEVVANRIGAKVLSQAVGGTRSIPTAGVFSQPGTITVSGSSAVTVADDGSLSVNVNALFASVTITITCTNSGGTATSTFTLSVVAAQAEFTAAGGSINTGNGTFTAYGRGNVIIAHAKRHSTSDPIPVPDLTSFTGTGKWQIVNQEAAANGGGYALTLWRIAQSDGLDGSLGTFDAGSVVFAAYSGVDQANPIGAFAGGFQAAATNVDYPALTLLGTNSIIHQYCSMKSGVTGQAPNLPAGYTNRLQNPGPSGVRQVIGTSVTPAVSRAAVADVNHTVTTGVSGEIYTFALEIRGAASAAASGAPSPVAANMWAASEVTDPAVADAAGKSGVNGVIKITFDANITRQVINSSGTYNLVLAAKGAALGAGAILVTQEMVTNGFYSSGSAVGSSIAPKLGWKKGDGATAEYFDGGSKSAITIQGLSGTGAVVVKATPTTWKTVITNAAAGSEVHLAPGNYGSLQLKNITKGTSAQSTWVRIRPEDRANPPKMTGLLDVSRCKGLIFDGLWRDNSGSLDTDRGKQKTVEFPNGSYVPKGKGFKFYDNENILITDIYFSYLHEAMDVRRNNNIEICYCTHEFWGMDVCRLFDGNTNVKFHHNVARKSLIHYPTIEEDDRHPDGIIQLATDGANNQTTDVHIHHNYLKVTQLGGSTGSTNLTATGTNASGKLSVHGIFAGNNAVRSTDINNGLGLPFASKRYERITVEDNYIETNDQNGIAFEASKDLTIRRNLLVRANADTMTDATNADWNPGILLMSEFWDDVVIDNNMVSGKRSDGTADVYLWNRPSDAKKRNHYWRDASSEITITNLLLNNANQTLKPTGWADLVPSPATGAMPAIRSGNCGQYAVR